MYNQVDHSASPINIPVAASSNIGDNSQGIQIAPGEGNRPIPLHLDEYAEELSFPKIYCGMKRKFKENVKITYTDIVKSELLRHDPRACVPTKVLYSFKKAFNERVRSGISIYLRKGKGTRNFMASQVKRAEFVKNIIKNDEGYAVWKNLRSSPSYWAAKCKKVVAMVRQLGRCTFFITLSAAETKWPELLSFLKKRSDNTDITEGEAEALPRMEKNELIRNDPVSCMRHFDQRYRSLKKNLLMAQNGKLTDFY